jgi:hypothetical protein
MFGLLLGGWLPYPSFFLLSLICVYKMAFLEFDQSCRALGLFFFREILPPLTGREFPLKHPMIRQDALLFFGQTFP